MNSLTRIGLPGPDVPLLQTASERPFQWLPDLLLFLRRRWRIMALSLTGVLAVAVIYLMVATPKFTATAALLIDTQAAALLQNQPTVNDSQYINGLVESQVEVVQSEGVARAVVHKLKLTDDPAFLANGQSPLNDAVGLVVGLFSDPRQYDASQRETLATELLQKMIDVKRIGTSYVIELSVRSLDPVMSARLANAVANAYAEAGLNAKSDATRHAGVWMDSRLRDLREQALTADQAVQTFKAQHNIVDTDKGLMNQRALDELNKQLVLAHTHVAETKARFDQIQSVLQNANTPGSVPDAMQDDVISKLRVQYLDDERLRSLWASKYGETHAAVLNLSAQMDTIRKSIQAELSRIAQGYRSDYQAAMAGEQAIQQRLDQLAQAAAGTDQNLVTLRGLQSQAETYRTLYSSFLQRYTQAMQDESFPVAQSQVVTEAVAPVKRSSPKTPLVLAGAGVLGIALGFALAILRDTMDRGVRTGAQLRAALGVDCLGLLPMIPKADHPRSRRHKLARTEPAARSLAYWPALLRHAATDPMSPCAEVMRRTRMRLTQIPTEKGTAKVIGCVSARSGEGKSTISANLAAGMAAAGLRTLLIDWDLRKLSLTTALAAGQPAGFVDLIAGARRPVTDVLWQDPVSQLRFLPGGSSNETSLVCAPEALNMPPAEALLQTLRKHYDCIVVDLPAMEVAADADAAATMVDALLLVVEWGRTDIDSIVECLSSTQAIAPRLIGAVLNKVDMRALRRYADYGVNVRPVAYGVPAAAE